MSLLILSRFVAHFCSHNVLYNLSFFTHILFNFRWICPWWYFELSFELLFTWFHFLIVLPKIAKFNSAYSQPSGSLFMLTCNVYQGSEPLHFQWLKNDGPIDHGHRSANIVIEIKDSFSHLSVKNIGLDDSANYSCVVSNQIGFDTQWSVLQVKGLWDLEYSVSWTSNVSQSFRSVALDRLLKGQNYWLISGLVYTDWFFLDIELCFPILNFLKMNYLTVLHIFFAISIVFTSGNFSLHTFMAI